MINATVKLTIPADLPNLVSSIKAIRSIGSLGLKEAKDICDRRPTTFQTSMWYGDPASLNNLVADVRIQGIGVDVTYHTDTGHQVAPKDITHEIRELAKASIDQDKFALAQSLLAILRSHA